VALRQVFSEYFGFPCQSFHQFLHHHNHTGAGTIGLLVAAVPSGPNWTPPPTIPIKKFVHLGSTLIFVMGFYSGLSGRVRTVCLFSLCVVSLLSDMFTASALVWFYHFLKYFVFHLLISLSTAFICRSSWILWLFMYQGAFCTNIFSLKLMMVMEETLKAHVVCHRLPEHYISAFLISFYTENCILHGILVLNPSMNCHHVAESFLRSQQFGITEFLDVIYRPVF
jgi:hypothetical protein